MTPCTLVVARCSKVCCGSVALVQWLNSSAWRLLTHSPGEPGSRHMRRGESSSKDLRVRHDGQSMRSHGSSERNPVALHNSTVAVRKRKSLRHPAASLFGPSSAVRASQWAGTKGSLVFLFKHAQFSIFLCSLPQPWRNTRRGTLDCARGNEAQCHFCACCSKHGGYYLIRRPQCLQLLR